MRMSRSPQNGGFQRSTGGGPLAPARRSAPVIASSPDCPSFAMVCLKRERELVSRGRVNRCIVIATPHHLALDPSSSRRMTASAQDLLQAIGAYIAPLKSSANLG